MSPERYADGVLNASRHLIDPPSQRRFRSQVGVTLGSLLVALVLGACGSDKEPEAAQDAVIPWGSGPCVAADGSAPQQRVFTAAPQQCIDVSKTYLVTMTTSKGSMIFELLDDKAPITVNSFVNLIRAKYYDGIYFHRTVPDFVLQAGDPGATSVSELAKAGAGGPGYTFIDELPEGGEYEVGALAMANAGPNTNGSQFFVISGSAGTTLPPNYSLFGRLTDDATNKSTLEAIAALAVVDGPPSEPVVIQSMTVVER
jgi:cyclophilin family peptidyl-prolyl cis-trans isomerase